MGLHLGGDITGMWWDGDVTAVYAGADLVWQAIITVTPPAPVFLDESPWIELPTVEGVTYHVQGTPGAGATITVTAVAEDGYQLEGTTQWSHTWPLPPYNARINKSGNFTIPNRLTRYTLTGWTADPGYPDTLYVNDGILVEAGTYHIEARVQYNRSHDQGSIDVRINGDRTPENGLVQSGPAGNVVQTSGTVDLPAGTVQLTANKSSNEDVSVQASGTWLHIERV